MELGISLAVPILAGQQNAAEETQSVQAEIVITHRSRLQVAPESFIFEVALSGFDARAPVSGEIYDARFHDLYYFWDFGDAYTFAAPQNLEAAHLNADKAYGPVAAHTYRLPGQYSVSVTVIEPASGKQATASLTVAIGHPDSLFFGNNTVFVDPNSDWSNAPAGALQVGSLNAAIAALQGNDSQPGRIILNRGKTYGFSGANLGQNAGQEWPSCHIVAGNSAGEKPNVVCSGGLFWWDDQTTGNGRDKDFVIQNIDFTGPFDSTTNSGPQINGIETFNNPPHLLLVDGCAFDGFGHAIYNDAIVSSNVEHRVTVLNDTTITNFANWGLADSNKTALAVTGCSIRAHVDALVDATPNQGAPIRTGGADRLNIIHSSEFFSRQGWSPLGSYLAVQPCIRLNSEGYEGSKSVVQASSFEGGYTVMSLQRAHGSTAHAGNVVVEKNVILGNYQSYDLIGTHMGGVTIRNNLLVFPDTERLPTTNDPISFVAGSNPDSDPVNRDAPIRIYNNTMVNLLSVTNHLSAAEAVPEWNNSEFSAGIARNNIVHQPFLTVPVVSDLPLESSAFLWTAYEKGYQTSSVPLQTQTATPSDTVASYAPLLGSPALGDADETQPVAFDDFYGNERPQYPSRGAFEMPGQ